MGKFGLLLMAGGLVINLQKVIGQMTQIERFSSNGGAAFSPDGKKIAFFSDRDKNSEIYVMNADGSGQTRLTNHDSTDFAPSWSPDGKKIAFFSKRAGTHNLYIMNDDGSDVNRITEGYSVIGKPLWLPDGKTILFTHYVRGLSEIYSIELATKKVTNLTNHPASDGEPTLMPSGRIMFHSNRDSISKTFHLYTMEKDGSDVKRLLPGVHERHDKGSISPDGTKIVFMGNLAFSDREIYVVSPDLKYKLNLSQNPNEFDNEPCWSPDGKKIIFESIRENRKSVDIYEINPDGTGLKRLTNLQKQ